MGHKRTEHMLCETYDRNTKSQGRCSQGDTMSLIRSGKGLVTKDNGLRGQDDQSWTMKYTRLRRSKVKYKSTRVDS
jgi:hypothetical protein